MLNIQTEDSVCDCVCASQQSIHFSNQKYTKAFETEAAARHTKHSWLRFRLNSAGMKPVLNVLIENNNTTP